MPTYEYKCERCGHRFEVFQSMNDARLTDCRVEGCAGPIRRLIGTGAGIIFKGSGFYQTDYRSESYKQAAKSESGASGGGGDAGGSSSTPAPSPAPAQASPAPAAAPPASGGGASGT